MEMEDAVWCGLFLFVALCLFVFGVGMESSEIAPSGYAELTAMVKTSGEMASAREAMADGKVTFAEYGDIVSRIDGGVRGRLEDIAREELSKKLAAGAAKAP